MPSGDRDEGPFAEPEDGKKKPPPRWLLVEKNRGPTNVNAPIASLASCVRMPIVGTSPPS